MFFVLAISCSQNQTLITLDCLPDMCPTFLGVILKPASLMSGKQGKNGEILWLEAIELLFA